MVLLIVFKPRPPGGLVTDTTQNLHCKQKIRNHKMSRYFICNMKIEQV